MTIATEDETTAVPERCLPPLAGLRGVDLTGALGHLGGRLLVDLGIVSFSDFVQRAAEVEASLPDIWSVAEEIMDAQSAMTD